MKTVKNRAPTQILTLFISTKMISCNLSTIKNVVGGFSTGSTPQITGRQKWRLFCVKWSAATDTKQTTLLTVRVNLHC